MSANLDFTPFQILSVHGQMYQGIRPSEIPKPFKSVLVILGGQSYTPSLPPNYTKEDILGYGAAIRVGLNLGLSGKSTGEDKAYRLVTLLKDGRKWSKLIALNGNITEGWS